MIRRYRISEQGKAHMLRRHKQRGAPLIAAMIVMAAIVIFSRRGPEGLTILDLIPLLAFTAVGVIVFGWKIRQLRDTVDTISIILSDDEIAEMRGDTVMLAVRRDRIVGIEVDAAGTIFVMSNDGVVALTIRPDFVETDDLRLRLSHEYGIRPRAAEARSNTLVKVRNAVTAVAIIAMFLLDTPALYGIAFATYTGLYLWGLIELRRLYDARSRLVRGAQSGGLVVLLGILRFVVLLHWI